MNVEKHRSEGLLSSNAIKILACIFMAVDHVGVCIFPDIIAFRAIGRLAFPLFAFFIAEGCAYTRNKPKRLFTMLFWGVLYFCFYYFYSKIIYANIFMTFSVSIMLIYLLQFCKKTVFEKPTVTRMIGSALIFAAALFAAYMLFKFISFDYGFKGMLVPVLVSLFDFRGLSVPRTLSRLDNKYVKLICFSIGLLWLAINANFGYWQFCSFFSLIPLLLYNGNVGNKRMKYMFYIFYPLHLLVIEGIAMLIKLI